MRDNWSEFEFSEIIKSSQLGTDLIGNENNSGIPLLKMGNLTVGGFSFKKLEKLKVSDPNEVKKFVLNKGDFLFNTRNTLELVGKSAVWNNALALATFNSNIMRIKFNESLADDFYLGYYFSEGEGWAQFKRITTGTTSVAAIYSRDLFKCQINLPPLPQQKKIAKILSTVDKVIEKTESAIAKYQAIKQGLMHDLFTRGINVNTGKLRPTPQDAPDLYKESALGLIPRDWEIETLRDITNINQGLQIAISQRHKTEGENRFVYITIQYLNNLDSDSYKYYIENPTANVICYEDDILMVRTGNTGMIVTDIVGAFHNNFFKIDYNESVLKEFLVYFLKRDIIQDLILNYAGTTTIPDLKHSDFYKIPFNKPTIIEQKLIIDKLKAIDNKIQTEQQALAKYQQLKAGLLQDLLTGKVEVGVD